MILIKRFILLFSLFSSIMSFAQLLELDFSEKRREESAFRLHVLRYGIVGISSLKHLDLSAELVKVRFEQGGGTQFSFTLYSTQTLWKGNKKEPLNTFDFLMNPIGGTINGAFFIGFPLTPQHKNSKFAFSLGKKWIQGQPLPQFKSSRFMANYSRLGWSYQKLLAEDPLTNSSLSIWSFPHLLVQQASVKSRDSFFDSQIDPWAYGYGAEIGLEYNTQLKVILHGQQLLPSFAQGDYNRFTARLTLAYRF
jgi:hypothetical protein